MTTALDPDVGLLLGVLEMHRSEETPDAAKLEDLAQQLRARGLGVCAGCYCTDVTACEPPCWWVTPELCSGCWD